MTGNIIFPHESHSNDLYSENIAHPLRRSTDHEAWSEAARDAAAATANGDNARQNCDRAGRRRTDGLNSDSYERKARVWKSLLERQSVATLLGAMLLLSMFVFVTLASLVRAQVPPLVSDAFLLILGYFFGHAETSNSTG